MRGYELIALSRNGLRQAHGPLSPIRADEYRGDRVHQRRYPGASAVVGCFRMKNDAATAMRETTPP